MSAFDDAFKAATAPEPASEDGAEAPVILGSPRGGGEIDADKREPWRPPRSKSVGEAVARHYGTTN